VPAPSSPSAPPAPAPSEDSSASEPPPANPPEADIQDVAPPPPPDGSGQTPEVASPKVAAAARKSLEEAAERERKLQEYVDSRQYFIPINAVAHKRSIKISLGMTLMLFLLALVLIDLMLDSGMILLIQKIPHTHFFNILNNN
jgi:hypothetical protein